MEDSVEFWRHRSLFDSCPILAPTGSHNKAPEQNEEAEEAPFASKEANQWPERAKCWPWIGILAAISRL